MWYVYILKCNDDSYHTGCTNDLKDWLRRHNNREVHYTKSPLPIVLVTYVAFSNKYKAGHFQFATESEHLLAHFKIGHFENQFCRKNLLLPSSIVKS